MSDLIAILVAVDGSANSDRAVRHAVAMAQAMPGTALHLLNVQPSLGGVVGMFVPKANIDAFHREEGEKALASAQKICVEAGVQAAAHIGVGRVGPVVRDFLHRLGCRSVVMGTRGHSGIAGVLLGSVAQDVITHIDAPICLVK